MKILLHYLRLGVALIALYYLGQNLLMAQSFVAHDLFLPIGYERVAYIDADEYADLVQIQYGALVWRANDGAGNFGDPQPLPLPNDYAMRTLDIDQDGDRDALFLNLNIWYENDGTQNYTPHPIAPAFVAPDKVYVRDADGDGDIDFAEIGSTGSLCSVHWYMNDGNGNFAVQYTDVDASSLNLMQFPMPFLMNSNTDGLLDIVFLSYNSFNSMGNMDTMATYTMLNDGMGNFGNVQQKLIMINDSLGNCIYGADLEDCAVMYSTWTSTGVGDLDGDGDDELGVNVQFSTFEDHSSFNAFYRNNESDEIWEVELTGQPYACYPQEGEVCDYEPYPLFSYDINRDGRQDLMGYFGLRLQQPDGSLSEPVFHCGSPENERQIFKMDSIHFDDVVEILPALELSDKWVANDSICTEHYLQDPNSLKIFGQMQLADTDNDSDMDIIFNDAERVTLLINQGDTAYSRKQVYYYPNIHADYYPYEGRGTRLLNIVDMDNDGLLDLVANQYHGSASAGGHFNGYWYRNLGNNNFSTGLNISNLFDVFLADIDTDGDIDVLGRRITWSEVSNYAVQLQVSPGVFGTVAPSTTPPFSFALPIYKTSDIDQDGDQDLWLHQGSTSIWISLQNADSTFADPTLLVEGISHINITDLDNDGDDDLVYKNDNHISMQLNNAGTFSLVELINEVSPAHYPQMINLNADVLPDLVINSDTVAYAPFVLFNSSTGFGSAQPFPSDVVQIQHFDQLDNDLSNDIFYTDATGRLWLRQNDGQGGFEAYAPIYIADNAAIHDVGDMNSDGKNDVLCRNYLLFDPDGVTYFLNQNIVVGIASPNMTNAAINLYPNPVSHTLYIDQKQNLAAQATQLQISNILGQIVYQAQLAPNTPTQILTLPPLSNGLYFAALYDQSDKLVHRQKISKH